MTLTLPPRVPGLLLWGLLALAIDLVVCLMLAGGDNGAGVFMLFQLGGFLGYLGGVEALTWMATDSPWARARDPRSLDEPRQALRGQIEPLPRGYVNRRLAMLRRWDFAAWRGYALRLMSGASLVWLSATLFLFYLAPHCPEKLVFLAFWSLLLFIRLVPLGCAAAFLVPILLVAVPRRPTPGELFHAALASGASSLVLLQVWTVNKPPVGDFLAAILQAGCNFWGWPYAVMIGGLLWYVVANLTGQARE